MASTFTINFQPHSEEDRAWLESVLLEMARRGLLLLAGDAPIRKAISEERKKGLQALREYVASSNFSKVDKIEIPDRDWKNAR